MGHTWVSVNLISLKVLEEKNKIVNMHVLRLGVDIELESVL